MVKNVILSIHKSKLRGKVTVSINSQRLGLKIALKFGKLSLKLIVSIAKETNLDNHELISSEGTVVAVSSALLLKESSVAVSNAVSLISGEAISTRADKSKDNSSVIICTSGNSFLNGTSLSLKLETKSVDTCAVSEFDIAKEISGSAV